MEETTGISNILLLLLSRMKIHIQHSISYFLLYCNFSFFLTALEFGNIPSRCNCSFSAFYHNCLKYHLTVKQAAAAPGLAALSDSRCSPSNRYGKKKNLFKLLPSYLHYSNTAILIQERNKLYMDKVLIFTKGMEVFS